MTQLQLLSSHIQTAMNVQGYTTDSIAQYLLDQGWTSTGDTWQGPFPISS